MCKLRSRPPDDSLHPSKNLLLANNLRIVVKSLWLNRMNLHGRSKCLSYDQKTMMTHYTLRKTPKSSPSPWLYTLGSKNLTSPCGDRAPFTRSLHHCFKRSAPNGGSNPGCMVKSRLQKMKGVAAFFEMSMESAISEVDGMPRYLAIYLSTCMRWE